MKKTLIQIVSKQAMPNLLAAMAIKPNRVVHICTPSMKKTSKALAQAYREAGVKPEVTEVPVSEKPLFGEMFNVVKRIVEISENPIVNFTGGTKPMSIGAYGAANTCRTPSVYVDTDRGEFLDGLTDGTVLDFFTDGNLSLAQVNRQLIVNAITKANGVERVTGGKQWKPYVKLADKLLRNPKLEGQCHDYVSEILKNKPKVYAQCKEWWRNVYSQPINLPLTVCELAIEAGLFEKDNDSFYPSRKWFEKLDLLDLINDRYPKEKINDAMNEVQWPLAFFNGNWWEVAVMRYYAEQGRFRDLRWSADAGSRTVNSTNMEEDILGVDGVNLLYVSCKRGGERAKLSRTLEDVNSSAVRLGGDFARKVFAVYCEIPYALRTSIENRCRELKLQLLTRKDVLTCPPLV